MLEKMGWENGKGLGLNEEGGTDFVKITKKRDNSGECHVIYGSIYRMHLESVWVFDRILRSYHARKSTNLCSINLCLVALTSLIYFRGGVKD